MQTHIRKHTFWLFFSLFLFSGTVIFGQNPTPYSPPAFAKTWNLPDVHPDRIVLTISGDPATQRAVTWRTDSTVTEAYAEIAIATAAPKFWRNARRIKAITTPMDARDIPTAELLAHYHSVTFTELSPDTLYAYRVGDGKHWSEWFQFRTASQKEAPYSFLYVGDAQNYVMELWSRLIREGYRKAPNADFIIHAGDLINRAHNDREWHEWFTAGGWIHAMLSGVPLPGNHEYRSYSSALKKRKLSVQWQPQFTLPKNGPKGMPELEETVYYFDYQGTRFVILNSNGKHEEQAVWLEDVLSDNPNTWTIVSFHHPVYSASEGRDNGKIRKLWKPIFDKYQVDLALQGHDHSYARGRVNPLEENVLDGVNARDYTGTVYVVSVSGGKMYSLKKNGWDNYEAIRDRAAENTQLIQLIEVNGNTLSYYAYTATGEVYDAFDLVKEKAGKANRFVERKSEAIPARRHKNTIPYKDAAPKSEKKE